MPPPLPWPPPESAAWLPPEREAVARLDPARMPRHVAVIMDGNGRWARSRGFLERVRGHEAGIESVREIVRTSGQLRLEVLTLYSFSKENWSRPRFEVAALMSLLSKFLVDERPELMDNGVRLTVVGRPDDLPDEARRRLRETMELTRANAGLNLVLALSYGGRDEIIRAARGLARRAVAGEISPDGIDEAAFSDALDTAGLPDPDLLIRTSGEHRVSNFLLWQIAYAELHVTPVLWPDFRRAHLLEALSDYQRRDRRFGGVGPQS